MSQTFPFQNPPLPPDRLVFGQSRAMASLRRKLEKVSAADIPLLIEGEGGTGKETLARWVHAHSPWANGQFVKVNCAAIPGTLLESELFGYQKGSFTGASSYKPGRVESAHRGTLLLDEIGELETSVQAKLLQFLQDGRFRRLGEETEQRVDARVICTTNRNLEMEVQAGRFRKDLFYRINVIRVRMPRLCDRSEDILALAEYLLNCHCGRFQCSAPPISGEVAQYLLSRSWPGNIRELENWTARNAVLGPEDALKSTPNTKGLGRPLLRPPEGGAISLKRLARDTVHRIERDLILGVLQANHWNRRKAAQVLKISYRALIYKLRDAGLTPTRASKSSSSADMAKESRGEGI